MKKMLIYTLIIMIILIHPINAGAINNDVKITITDALGRTIVLDKIPQRVVSLAPSITETLFYFGLQKYVIGVDNISYTDQYFGIEEYIRAHNITPVGGYWWSAISVEKILELRPDIVLADKGAHKPLLEVLEQYNITVVYLNAGSARSIQDIYLDLDIVAKIFNVSADKVSRFIKDLENEISVYHDLISSRGSIKVLVIVGIYNGIWVAGKSTYVDDLINRLGMNNVAEVIGWKSVNIETIAGWEPDIILVADAWIDNETLKSVGLYDLNVPVVLLNQTVTDALSRPGPLIIELPRLIYSIIDKYRSISSTTTNISITGNINTISTTNNTLLDSIEKTQEQTDKSYYITVATMVAPSFIIGLIAGYILFRRSRW